MLKKHTWYEVTDGEVGNKFKTLNEARQELIEMKQGYPNKYNIRAYHREYWRVHAKRMHVVRVTQIIKKLK